MELSGEYKDMLSEWNHIQAKLATLKDEWDIFMRTEKVEANSVIPAEVISSWYRCKERGLNPYAENNVILAKKELSASQQKMEALIKITEPILDEMVEVIGDPGFRFDIYDENLYLIKRVGIKQGIGAPKRDLPLGISFKECHMGTNAVSIAYLLEREVQLMGCEHYNAMNHRFACAAIPIFDTGGNIMAIIHCECNYWPFHKHTLSMLLGIKRVVEAGYRIHITKDTDATCDKLEETAMNTLPEMIVLVSGDGRIVKMNKKAKKVLGHGKDYTGYFTKTLWGEREPFAQVIKTKNPLINDNVSFNVDGMALRLTGSFTPTISDEGMVMGVAGIMQDYAAKKLDNDAWKTAFDFSDILTCSANMRQTIRFAKEASSIETNVLIQGESGTGKELFAQAIHSESSYRDGPFVAINCAAIPSGLMETDLFGYESGAYTGAKRDGQIGKFELARGGTLFLDEINSMPLEMQAKLLRATQDKTIVKVGGNRCVPIDVRIITASNVDLWDLVKKGLFREDLFYRINVISINIPPLRERKEDIHILVKHALHKLSTEVKQIFSIEDGVFEILMSHHWPGNVRELENTIIRGMVSAKSRGSSLIEPEDISFPYFSESNSKENPAPDNQTPSLEQEYEEDGLEAFERSHIEKALKNNAWNIKKTAAALNISRNTLYKKIEKYEILRED